MKKFYIKTLGCKTNAVESQIMAQNLKSKGFIEVLNKNEADIYIINSCTVTSHSSNQVLYLLKQAKKENPYVKTVLTGCMAQAAIKKERDIDLILGNNEKLEVEKYIDYLFETPLKRDGHIEFVQDIFEIKEYKNKIIHNSKSTRPSVKIQDGCNNRCSYCLIPYVRGNSRSNTVDNIIKQINIHTKEGKKEIVITGIHIGQWGNEFNLKLTDLLKEIEKTDIKRYRLGSLYINELDDKLFKFLTASKKFCPHFHLSLQSLTDKTLKNMNRFYTKKEVIDVVQRIKDNFNLPFIGCDIITGFPNETHEDFLETKETLNMLKVSYIHSFPYSVRNGTKAASMENQVLEHIKKERTKELIELCKILHNEFLQANKTTTREILYEKKGKNGLYKGISENYIKVYKKSDTNLQNTLESVSLTEFNELY